MDTNLIDEAMKIPPRERVVLAELMLESIEHEGKHVKEAWISEVKNRMKMVMEDKSKLLDFDSIC